MTVSITDLTSNVTTTNNVVSGDGIFDDMMESVNSHLENQFQLGRLTGTDYATVYLGAIQSTIQTAAQYAMGVEKTNAEVAVLAQKQVTEYAQTQQTNNTAPATGSILGRQSTLYEQQAKGFQWNADQKYLDTILSAWSMNVNTAGVPSTAVDALGATGTVNINTVIEDAKPT